jgi:hypothetical protein
LDFISISGKLIINKICKLVSKLNVLTRKLIRI